MYLDICMCPDLSYVQVLLPLYFHVSTHKCTIMCMYYVHMHGCIDMIRLYLYIMHILL